MRVLAAAAVAACSLFLAGMAAVALLVTASSSSPQSSSYAACVGFSPGGVASSASYQAKVSLGQTLTGQAQSASYRMEAGFSKACVYTGLDPDNDQRLFPQDNCPNWYNPAQNLPPWPVAPGDPDCDGWTDADEGLIGTGPTRACGTDWPANMNNVNSPNKVDIFDVNQLAPPVFFSAPPSINYSVRKDLTAGHAVTDPKIDIFDVHKLAPPVFFASCTP